MLKWLTLKSTIKSSPDFESDGASLYITRDIATAVYRENTYHPAMNLYVVGSEQTYYQTIKGCADGNGLTFR